MGWEGREIPKGFGGNPEEKRSLGWHTHQWKDNSKLDLRMIEQGCTYWTDLAQDTDQFIALVNTVMNFWGP
jgi:hypothetical protein